MQKYIYNMKQYNTINTVQTTVKSILRKTIEHSAIPLNLVEHGNVQKTNVLQIRYKIKKTNLVTQGTMMYFAGLSN